MIQERELEVDRLTKVIEFEKPEQTSSEGGHFLGISNDSKSGAIPVIKSKDVVVGNNENSHSKSVNTGNEAKTENESDDKKKDHHYGGAALGIAGGILAAAGAGALAAGSAGKNAVSGIASGVSNAVPSGNKDVQLPSNGSGTQGNTTTSAPGQSQSLSPLATTTEPSGSAASIPTSSNTSTISSKKNAASVTPTPVEAQRTNSLSDKFKGWGRKLSKKDKSKDVNSAAGETTAETGVIAKDDDKPVGGITALDAEKNTVVARDAKPIGGVTALDAEKNTVVARDTKPIGGINANDIEEKPSVGIFVSKNVSSNKTSTDADDESFEIQSVYEVVSDSEYEANKHNPNYFEVSPEEFEKHKNLENKVVLIEKISE